MVFSVLKRLGNASVVQVIAAGMGCGFVALLVFVIAFLVLTSRFGPSGSGQVTLEVEPYLTALASDSPASSPSATTTIPATEHPWVAPPSGKIVYTCFFDGYDEICIMDADGRNQHRLTEIKATDFYASLSTDASSILFSSRRLEGFQIYRMDLDGENVERLTEGIGSLYAPSVSPDGRTIVFTRERESRQTIWVMDSDGSNPRALTESSWDDIDPEWSPDGTQISFASNRSGSRQLYVMEADGSDIRKVTPELPDMGGRNDWSADGKTLTFYAGPRYDRDIYLIDVDGDNLRQLTDGGDNLGPSFSPDGAWIAFTSYRDGNNEIYIMNIYGGQVTRLTENAWPEWQPRWSR